MTGDQRGDGEDNILAGYGEILVMGTLRMLDAGLTYIDAGLCTDQGWIRRRFGINRRKFVSKRRTETDADLCLLDAELLNLLTIN